MIAYLSGRLVESSEEELIIEVHGVGYRVFVSKRTSEHFRERETVRILTYLSIKEDSHTLYGFRSTEERQMFEWLISVSGIGTGTARTMLSYMDPGEIGNAILAENSAAFHKVKGVGPKTAKRIVLDLKDKIVKSGGQINTAVVKTDNTSKTEALSALIALGIPRPKAIRAIHLAVEKNPDLGTVERIVKQALKLMS